MTQYVVVFYAIDPDGGDEIVGTVYGAFETLDAAEQWAQQHPRDTDVEEYAVQKMYPPV